MADTSGISCTPPMLAHTFTAWFFPGLWKVSCTVLEWNTPWSEELCKCFGIALGITVCFQILFLSSTPSMPVSTTAFIQAEYLEKVNFVDLIIKIKVFVVKLHICSAAIDQCCDFQVFLPFCSTERSLTGLSQLHYCSDFSRNHVLVVGFFIIQIGPTNPGLEAN